MWERIRTAIILLIIVGVAMFATRSPVLMLPLLLVGAGIAALEWAKLMPDWHSDPSCYQTPTPQIPCKTTRVGDFVYMTVILVGIGALLGGSLLVKAADWHWLWVVLWALSSVIWLLVIGWVGRYPEHTQAWYGKGLYVMGGVILCAALTAIYYLWSLSAWWLLYVFVLVWCADSGAYFVGRKLGKRKMSPHVSPNKSVEGLIGGLVTGVLVVLAVTFGLHADWSTAAIGVFLLLSLVTIVMSVFGDLFESMLKRHAGVKDAGLLLPGHGGVLDRIDSQLSAMPIFALGFWLMQYVGLIQIPV